jgi:TonB-linked SusC/RagA family outer membrane protein
MYPRIVKNITILLFAMAISISAWSQQITVTGKVTDLSDGSPLIGVNVIIKGTTIGTVTDFDGNYTIQSIPNATILFSYLGYASTEEQIGNRTTINVSLKPAFESLEEIIVIGYGTQRKSDRTGAIGHVTSDEINAGVLTDAIQSIQGKVAGVIITKQGGDPNAGFDVRIRGASSLATNVAPLYVIDGVPGADPTTVSPDDIQSFNILKDASAAAIYGARGANGVIIITTKRGERREGSRVEFNNYISIENTANRLDLLSANEIRKFVTDNPGFQTFFYDGGANTDWQNEIYRTGSSQNYSLAVSGGDKNTFYRTSIAHSNFKGIIQGSEKTRTTARVNLDQSALDGRLKVSSGISGTFERNDYINYGGWGANQTLFQAFRRNPTDPVKNDDGSFHEIVRTGVFEYYNPVNLIEQIQNERDAKRFFGFIKTDLEIIKGLVGSVNLAYTRNDHETFYFEPTTMYTNTHAGYGNRAYDNYESRLLETTLNYENSFGNHNLQTVAGYSFQEEMGTNFFMQGREPFINYAGVNNFSFFQSVVPGRDLRSGKWDSRLISFFARTIYNWDSKYYLTATIRRDGSSKFGVNNEWGWFPSASAMWNIAREDFMSNIDIVSNLRLRAGFGITGNQEIGNYNAITYYVYGGTAPNFETGEQSILVNFSHAANPNLKWEENAEINIGIDFGFLRDRISGSIELFQKNTYDLLGSYSVPMPPNIADKIWANVGHFRTSGIEIFLQAFPLNRPNFKWKTAFTFTTYKQEVVSLSKGTYEWATAYVGDLSGPGVVGDRNTAQIVKPGYPLGTFFMPEYAGLSNDGVFLFYTATGGVTRDLRFAERRAVGSAQPDFELGWSNYFDIYKNFDMSFAVRTVYGHQIFNTTRLILGNPNFLPSENVLNVAVDEWNRGLRDRPKVSSYYLEDGSFIRLDNISIGYNFDKIKGFDRIRVYFASNNVFTLTNYSGIDPEINFSGLSFGLDQFSIYPKTRTFTFGISLTL